MIRTLLVDDEPLAREGLRLLTAGEPDLEIVGEAASGEEAVDLVHRLEPDLVLLDVQMPGMDGFEVVRRIAGGPLPAIVFVTAFDEFALRAFEVHALDFLLKPPSRDRLRRALDRVRELAAREDAAGATAIRDLVETLEPAGTVRRFVVRDRNHFVLVPVEEIVWIDAAGNYAELHARGRTFLLRATMNALERQLDAARFARIHRSAIVAIPHVTTIAPDGAGQHRVTLTDGTELRMTRGYRDRLLPKTAARG